MLGEPENGAPLRSLVCADSLEDAGAVVQAVRADVDLGVSPVDQLAVHPDLLELAHGLSSFGGRAVLRILPGGPAVNLAPQASTTRSLVCARTIRSSWAGATPTT